MEEVYNMYNHLIFVRLKDLVNGYVTVRTDLDTDSLFVSISDNYNIRPFYYRVHELDRHMHEGTFNANAVIENIIYHYKNYILSQFIKQN